jgi:LysM repeat protein
VRGDSWRRFAAPAAFLLAATIAVLLVRSGLHAGSDTATTSARVPTTPTKTVATTTTRRRTTRTTTTTASSTRFYTVQAGDTFEVISSKTGVSISNLQRLNPNVSSTSLFIGQKIRIK